MGMVLQHLLSNREFFLLAFLLGLEEGGHLKLGVDGLILVLLCLEA